MAVERAVPGLVCFITFDNGEGDVFITLRVSVCVSLLDNLTGY